MSINMNCGDLASKYHTSSTTLRYMCSLTGSTHMTTGAAYDVSMVSQMLLGRASSAESRCNAL